ncbi:aryl-sulfate sulfotransferase [Halosimplex sp. J119]
MKRRTLRIAVLCIVAASCLYLVSGYLNYSSAANAAAEQSELPFEDREEIVPPRDNVTVITGQGFADRARDSLTAFAPDGRVLYYHDEYSKYQDVDPSPKGRYTVTVIASEFIYPEECDASVRRCVRDNIVRINLTTGETETLYSMVAPALYSEKIHDVDRVGPNRFIVADIIYDRVYQLNTSTGMHEWSWQAMTEFPRSGGGEWPNDWTHLNDVEMLPDGRVMASLRNQDQVVFIDPETGLQENWTLGAEDDYSVLYEQHNPDYIPESRGGPAVVVADSHNNRVVEFQRRNGSWEQSWQWSDDDMQWTRDADRLPNGNTLIVDSNGGRVLEVDPNGTMVWNVTLSSAYDAERLGTGDESAGGWSAASQDLASSGEIERNTDDDDSGGVIDLIGLKRAFLRMAPAKLMSAVVFLVPPWMRVWHIAAIAASLASVFALFVAEVRWRYDVSLHVRDTIDVRRKGSDGD